MHHPQWEVVVMQTDAPPPRGGGDEKVEEHRKRGSSRQVGKRGEWWDHGKGVKKVEGRGRFEANGHGKLRGPKRGGV